MYFMKDETFTLRDGSPFIITTLPKGVDPAKLVRQGMSNEEINALIYEKEARNVTIVLAVLHAYRQVPQKTLNPKQTIDWADLIDQLIDEEEEPPEDGYHRIPNKGYEVMKLLAEWTVPEMPSGFIRMVRKINVLLTELPEEKPEDSPNGVVTPISVGVD